MIKIIKVLFLLLPLVMFAQDSVKEKELINKQVDAWHLAAAEANFNDYFSIMSDDAVFIGTDATENWQLDAFKKFAKPYFDRGKAWNFTALERNVYIDKAGKLAWFDELLDTQMKICRGSGVLKKIGGRWKIAHYVLSIAVPNENVDELVDIKQDFDNNLIERLKQ